MPRSSLSSEKLTAPSPFFAGRRHRRNHRTVAKCLFCFIIRLVVLISVCTLLLLLLRAIFPSLSDPSLRFSSFGRNHSINNTVKASEVNRAVKQPKEEVIHTPFELEETSLPKGCSPVVCGKSGGESFGTVLGVHEGVVAYSNCCSEHCISEVVHENTVKRERSATLSSSTKKKNSSALPFPHSFGMKWQCVEYARRYSILRGGVVKGKYGAASSSSSSLSERSTTPASFVWSFGEVDGAVDIWSLETALCYLTNRVVPLQKISNGNGSEPPQVGDLIIYSTADDFPFGHVAVVVGVHYDDDLSLSSSYTVANEQKQKGKKVNTKKGKKEKKKKIGDVFVAEQNWDNQKWQTGNYSRVMALEWVEQKESTERKGQKSTDSGKKTSKGVTGAVKKENRFALKDGSYTILGWVRPSNCYA